MSTPGWNQDQPQDPYRDPWQPQPQPYTDPSSAGAAAVGGEFHAPVPGQPWYPEGQGPEDHATGPVPDRPHQQQPYTRPAHPQQAHPPQAYPQPYPEPYPQQGAYPEQPYPQQAAAAHPVRTPYAPQATTSASASTQSTQSTQLLPQPSSPQRLSPSAQIPPPQPSVSPTPPNAPPAPSAAGAPHRTGSPIIAPGVQPAAATAGLCLLLALTAPLGRPALAFTVVLLQAVTAAGWFRLNGMWPARQGIALAFAAGLTADAVTLALDGEHAPATAMGTLGVWCLLVLVLQLRHHGAADERLYALTVAVSSTVVTVLAAGYLAAWSVGRPHAQGGEGGWWDGALVVVGAAAVAVAVLVRALPLPQVVSVSVALAAAAGGGAATGALTGVGAGGILLGVVAGGGALLGLRVASYDWPSRFVHLTAGVALPVAAAAPAVYLMGRVLAG